MTENKDKKKKPRPANLELKASNLTPNLTPNDNKDMKELALQCVSPGLPPLNAEMKSTVLISKSIEVQQRNLISARIASSSSEIDDETIQDDTNKGNSEYSSNLNTPTTSGLTNDMDELSIPSVKRNKRFKRDKAPPPLNLKLAQRSGRPVIKSAPIYGAATGYYTPATSRRQQFPKKRVLSVNRTTQRPRAVNFTPITPFEYQFRRQVPNTANPYTQYPLQRGIAVPKTATSFRNPLISRSAAPLTQRELARYQQHLAYQQQQWAKFKEYRDQRKVNHVTDVFEGDATRFAPPASQPLSAQRAFFNVDQIKPQAVLAAKKGADNIITEESNGEDKTAAYENEQVDTDENVDYHVDYDEDDDEDDDDGDSPESQAIEEDAKIGLNIRKESPVRAQISLGESVFQFNFERVENSPHNDKQRFLNFCATAWDQFNRL